MEPCTDEKLPGPSPTARSSSIERIAVYASKFQSDLTAVLEAIDSASVPTEYRPCQSALVLTPGPGADLRSLQRLPVRLGQLEELLPTQLLDVLIMQLLAAAAPVIQSARLQNEGESPPVAGSATSRYSASTHLLAAQNRFLTELLCPAADSAELTPRLLISCELSVRHACYLKSAIPGCKILCLLSDPYVAYRRAKAQRQIARAKHQGHADAILGVQQFGARWSRLSADFVENHKTIGAALVRVDECSESVLAKVASELGIALPAYESAFESREAVEEVLLPLSFHESIALDGEVRGLATTLGYSAPEPTASTAPALRLAPPLSPQRCVVLVPVGGHIEPQCETGLIELERRGYQVRRVRGFSAIDQGRNQMATDALADGFAETMWIDADIGFQPDAVERLRSHRLPLVSAIYPQKGRRALACHALPGTTEILFGAAGGLIELLYAPAGFLHVRREAYDAIQRSLELPVCNERDGHPLVPYFQPLVRELNSGHWYLAEDFAFCERARRAGLHIMADTSIRLLHLGTFGYSWEDAGSDRPRYDNYRFRLSGASPASSECGVRISHADRFVVLSPQELASRLDMLKAAHAWPTARPDVPLRPTLGWLSPSTKEMLQRAVQPECQLIVELGAFLGLSTRLLAALAPGATIVTVDHWRGSAEHQHDPALAMLLPNLYNTFLANCWSHRDRLIPLRMSTLEGLQKIAQSGVSPDLIYFDADHGYEAVKADVETARRLFPQAALVGDDWDWDGVRKAVTEIAQREALRLEIHGVAWRLS